MLAEREFNKLDNISAYKNKVEPCKYVWFWFLGCCSVVASIDMMIHIFMYAALRVDGKSLRPWINNVLEKIEPTAVGFLASVFLVILCYYLVLAAVRGNMKFGLRFFFVSFYPIVPRETFINSFFANCLIMNIWVL